MRVAIVGARWPDSELEREVMGLRDDEIVREPGATREEILQAASKAEVILTGPGPRFDKATIDRLDCRGIVRYGAGFDNVDIGAAHRRGIVVAYVPDYGTEAVALHAVSLTLAALRRIPQADRMVKAGGWDLASLRPLHLPSMLNAGVIGFGRIGRRVAEHFIGFGFRRVLAFDDRSEVDAPSVEATALETLLAESDVVSVHASGSPDGSPIIGSDAIELMRPGSVLVNTARGSLIESAALVAGLRVGRPALAALDVFDPEPAEAETFREVRDQVIMTPHMAWYTEETERSLRTKTAREARRILDHEPVLHPVIVPEGLR
jgi:D-3-phosphoglycerate dehydrogenase